eukprot:364913-Chlamydomonas_euryale.AAC.6
MQRGASRRVSVQNDLARRRDRMHAEHVQHAIVRGHGKHLLAICVVPRQQQRPCGRAPRRALHLQVQRRVCRRQRLRVGATRRLRAGVHEHHAAQPGASQAAVEAHRGSPLAPGPLARAAGAGAWAVTTCADNARWTACASTSSVLLTPRAVDASPRRSGTIAGLPCLCSSGARPAIPAIVTANLAAAAEGATAAGTQPLRDCPALLCRRCAAVVASRAAAPSLGTGPGMVPRARSDASGHSLKPEPAASNCGLPACRTAEKM